MNGMSAIVLGVLAVCAGIVYADEPWVGKWESIEGRQEHYKEFVQALGKPITDEEAKAKVTHEITKSGDHYQHKISVPNKNYLNNYQFKLNEEGKHTVGGQEFHFKYRAEGPKLIGDIRLGNKTIHEESQVNGEEMEKSYKVGDVNAKRFFKKQAN